MDQRTVYRNGTYKWIKKSKKYGGNAHTHPDVAGIPCNRSSILHFFIRVSSPSGIDYGLAECTLLGIPKVFAIFTEKGEYTDLKYFIYHHMVR